MNQSIANIIKGYIDELDFVDKIAGLTSVTYVNVLDENGNKVQKTYPVSCNTTAEDCKNGLYNDLAPDSKFKTVIYFEDGSVSFNSRQGNFVCFTSNLKLVCWINVPLYKADWCESGIPCTVSMEIIKKILCALPEHPVYSDPLSKVYPVVTSQEIRSNSIFSKYTYNELQTQYLMYPYDYFALNIQTTFCICMDCETVCDA